MRVEVCLLICVVFCYGEDVVTNGNTTRVRNGLEEKIGNFSIELLYHTALVQAPADNLIISPFTVWTVLAVISEGAAGRTRLEINNALRISSRNTENTRRQYADIAQWLQVKTNTIELAKYNAIFVDKQGLPLPDFQESAKRYYDTNMISLNFADNENAANLVNGAISNFTRGRIPKIVESSNFQNAKMLLTSALYFKGQWTIPFNASSTTVEPFYNSNGTKIGEVKMMYNRGTYPFANVKELKARVVELPYGKENRLSMIIMLPNHGVSLEDMFRNFLTVPLDLFFDELRISKEEFSDDEVDCFIPRFKIQSNLDISDVLQKQFHIKDLFDMNMARLPNMARTPMYVSKVIHKAEIDVTEEGTTASAVTVAEFSNRIGAVRFEANRPFTYIIVEKMTNSIVFGGFYKQPTLY